MSNFMKKYPLVICTYFSALYASEHEKWEYNNSTGYATLYQKRKCVEHHFPSKVEWQLLPSHESVRCIARYTRNNGTLHQYLFEKNLHKRTLRYQNEDTRNLEITVFLDFTWGGKTFPVMQKPPIKVSYLPIQGSTKYSNVLVNKEHSTVTFTRTQQYTRPLDESIHTHTTELETPIYQGAAIYNGYNLLLHPTLNSKELKK